MSSFVCARCREAVRDPYARCERRLVYRSAASGRVIEQVVEAVLCRPCVDAELAARRPVPSGAEPVALF